MKIKELFPSFDFVSWKPAQIARITAETIADTSAALDRLLTDYANNPRMTAEEFLGRLETLDTNRLMGSPVIMPDNVLNILVYCSTNTKQREAARTASDELESARSSLFIRADLYAAIEKLRVSRTTQSELFHLRAAWLNYLHTNGVHLTGASLRTFKKLRTQLTEYAAQFSKNISSYSETILCTADDLVGVPASMMDQFRAVAGGYAIGVTYPELNAIMSYATSDTTRRRMMANFRKRGGKQNITLLKKIAAARQKLAELLGLDSYVEYTTKRNLIGTPQKLQGFLGSVKKGIAGQVRTEQSAMRSYVASKGHEWTQFNASFWNREYLKERYAIDSSVVREYFPMEHVLTTCFELFEKYFGLRCTPVDDHEPLWHRDARLYQVVNTRTGTNHGYIVLDLFPRADKYTHMCMSQPITREVVNGEIRLPLAVMVGNFAPATKKTPSLLSLYEVTTLLHEFGHVLHGIAGNATYRTLSGASATVVDFVEIPSQCMEQFLTVPHYLEKFSSHYRTGESLPVDLRDRLLTTNNLFSASMIWRQWTMIELDTRLHAQVGADPVALWADVCREYGTFVEPKGFLMPAGFGHLASDMYGCSYWTYMVSLAYVYDAWNHMVDKKGRVIPAKAHAFFDEIMVPGAMRTESASLRAFLGRAPSTAAFLSYLKKSRV